MGMLLGITSFCWMPLPKRKWVPVCGHGGPFMSQALTKDFTPEGLIFPISASMLKSAADYNASLEAFSQQLIPFLE